MTVKTHYSEVAGSNKSGIGGAKRDRTADLLDANQTLSQLSYGPASYDWRCKPDIGGSGKSRTSDLTLIRGAL